MAFGWPARFVQLSPSPETDWDGEISRATTQFHRVEYNFLTWNCHSFLAAFLNNISWPQHGPNGKHSWLLDRRRRRLGIFIDGRYIGRHTGRRRWRWSAARRAAARCAAVGRDTRRHRLFVLVLARRGEIGTLRMHGRTRSLLATCFFLLLGSMALLRLSSTRGSVDLSTLTEVSEGEESDDDDDDGLVAQCCDSPSLRYNCMCAVQNPVRDSAL